MSRFDQDTLGFCSPVLAGRSKVPDLSLVGRWLGRLCCSCVGARQVGGSRCHPQQILVPTQEKQCLPNPLPGAPCHSTSPDSGPEHLTNWPGPGYGILMCRSQTGMCGHPIYRKITGDVTCPKGLNSQFAFKWIWLPVYITKWITFRYFFFYSFYS